MKDYYFGSVEGILRQEAIALHHQRYQEVGFFKKNEEDPYEKASTYFVAQTTELKEIVGVTRLIFMKIDDLPTIRHFNIYDIEKLKLSRLEKNKYAEISAFTKMPKHDVGLGLIKSVLQYSVVNGISHWVCCIDERVYKYMYRMFKFPFEVIGEPNVYLGSKTIPCALDLTECLETLKEKRGKLYDYFIENEENVMEVVK
jgi:N-acyl-L-homoserine lactone synthetase